MSERPECRPGRCRWCGVYVRRDTAPTPGANAFGTPLEQTLCPDCAQVWLDLTERNLTRLEAHPDDMDGVIEMLGGIR